MTIDEAIKTLSGNTSDLTIYEVPDFLDAIKLGIAALRARQRDRKHGYIDLDDLLPGETEEK